jgi:hypothetical protein
MNMPYFYFSFFLYLTLHFCQTVLYFLNSGLELLPEKFSANKYTLSNVSENHMTNMLLIFNEYVKFVYVLDVFHLQCKRFRK